MARRRSKQPTARKAVTRAAARGHARQRRHTFDQLVNARELFWNNVIREILTALSTLGVIRNENEAPADGTKNAEGASDPLDGRLAVVTATGERIPIAEVYPLFACGIPGTEAERALSVAVECTVFQIRTPAGEVYTLPLHEVRGFHALSEELMKQLEDAAGASGSRSGEPFGFAAFTSLSRSQTLSPDASMPNELAD